jgi:hypothetical protein
MKTPLSFEGIPRELSIIKTPKKLLLTPKIGAGKRLTCVPSLVKKHHSAGNFPQSIR